MASKRANGLIFVDNDHFFIRQKLEQKLIVEKAEGYDGKIEHVYVACCDFNNMEMLAMCSKKTNLFSVSVKVPCFEELVEAGAMDILKAKYGDLLLDDPMAPFPRKGREKKWNVTIQVDINNLPGPAEELVEKMSNLGRNLYAAPFERAFEALSNGTTASLKPVTLPYRAHEQVFVISSEHVVQVIFSLAFTDQVDRELARVFTVEFEEGGRLVEKAPGVNFYPAGKQPDELSDIPHQTDEETCIGYLVFAVSKNHVDKPGKVDRVCDLMVQFRSYLLYHIKATKTDLHSMMRKTYAELLKVKGRCAPNKKVISID